MKFELLFPEQTILEEIKDKGMTQEDIAATYRIIIEQDLEVNWKTINHPIIDRWSKTGLDKIKRLAWKGKTFNTEYV